MEPKVKRTKTPQQATTALMNLCARAERSSGDALRLMRGWGVSDADAREVLARLQRERFIDDSRYAAAFVRDKMRLAGWGAYKVATALRAKGVARDIIEEALREVGDDEVRERLVTLLMRRAKTVKGSSVADIRAKLLRFAASRGYDYSLARKCVERVVEADDVEPMF